MIYLENELVRFGFDQRNGSLVEINDKVSGQVHLTDPARGRLFRIMCPSELWDSRYADSHMADPPDIKSKPNGLTIHYPWVRIVAGPIEISATVNVELPDNSAEAMFKLEVNNNSTVRTHEIRFPWVGGWTGIAGRGQDRALCGCQFLDPHPKSPEIFTANYMKMDRREFYPYNNPGELPIFDISGNGRGLSYICYQERPNLGGMVVENLDPEPDALSLSFSWVHFPFVKPGEKWRSPIVGIGVHQGDWHATVDRLHAWTDRWWSAPPVPSRLAESIGFQAVLLRNFDGLPNYHFADVPRLAEAGLKYGVTDLCVWDPIMELYCRPDDGDIWEEFDPSQSLDDLRDALSEVKRMGVNVSPLLNFRLIRGNSKLYREVGEELVQRTVFGSPVREEYSNISSEHASCQYTNYLGREGFAICQKSDAFVERSLGILRKTLDLGFTSVFIDQTCDWNPCFAENHGHSSPDDTHVAAMEWASRVARIVRDNDPEGYVIGEVIDLFTSQHVNIAWNWAWFKRDAPEVMRYALPGALQCMVVDHQPSVLNRAFVMGFLMAFTSGKQQKSLDAYPEFGERVAQLGSLRKRLADFIVRGTFRDRVGLEVENTTAYVYDSPAGLAVAVADIDNETRRVKIALNPAALGHGKVGLGTLYRQDGSASPSGESAPGGRARLEFELPALEVAVWTLQGEAGC